MGFGHPVYRNYDPRATIIKQAAHDVLERMGVDDPLLDIALRLEAVALADEYFISRKLYPNVDFYTGLIYKAMGFPTKMFTVLFALGRLPGWIAQWREMIEDPQTKIGRPRQVYVGEAERELRRARGPWMIPAPYAPCRRPLRARCSYRRCGRSGLRLPAVSLGLWHNFGDDKPWRPSGRSCAGPSTSASPTSTWPTTTGRPTAPPRRNFGRHFARRLRSRTATSSCSRPRRATTCGRGRTASGGRGSTCSPRSTSRLARMGVDYVDIFYSHRLDPETPLEETMGALHTAVPAGQGAVRRHLVVLARAHRSRRPAILRDLGTPLLIHQPSYSLLNRWVEGGLLDALEDVGAGCITFSPLAQGMLTDRYLDGRTGGLTGGAGQVALARPADRPEPHAHPRARRPGRRRAASRWPSWRSRGRCATRG